MWRRNDSFDEPSVDKLALLLAWVGYYLIVFLIAILWR